VFLRDVDGDGKADRLVYEIRKWKNDYEGSLTITSATRKTLWEDRWLMVKGDLFELIETEGDVTGEKQNLGPGSSVTNAGTNRPHLRLSVAKTQLRHKKLTNSNL